MRPLYRQIATLALLALAVLAGVSLSRWTAGPATALEGATAYPQPRPLPAFSLVDHRGEPFSRDALRGDWHLLFFGFTRCPDVCPLTLSVLREAVAPSAPGAAPLADVVLVSVDPQRDTPALLADYVAGFSDDFTGVTGTPDAIAAFAAAVNVAYGRVPLGDGGDYTVDHSAVVLAVNPASALHAVFTPPLDAAVIRRDLTTLQRRYRGG